MKSKSLNIFFIVLIVFFCFLFRDRLGNIWRQAIQNYFPCMVSIKYSIGDFDDRFGISKEEFLSTIKSAENLWEKESGGDLFEYSPDGALKINLIYDVRQESTVQLKNIEDIVKGNKSDYDELKSKYNSIVSDYEQEKNSFQIRVANFDARQRAYEKDVSYWNNHGGADESTYKKLNSEKQYLDKEYEAIKNEQINLNQTVDQINTLIVSLNQLAKTLNLGVDEYNSIGQYLDAEFDEGVYRSSSDGQEIDIYQFENQNKLFRVLAHELGHALGLNHIDDPKAIMYRLNNGVNESLTQSDIDQLNNLCGISK